MANVSRHLENALPGTVVDAYVDKKSAHEVIRIPPEALREVVTILKNELAFDMLIDIVTIDWLSKKDKRFEVDYLFYSLKQNSRVNLKVTVADNENPFLDSIADIYGAANWAEREAWDMMGIRFKGHPKLRRILMWEEFEGHPLRKDYPIHKRQPIPVLAKLI